MLSPQKQAMVDAIKMMSKLPPERQKEVRRRAAEIRVELAEMEARKAQQSKPAQPK